MTSNSLYNKLAFNGYRVFIVEPPNWNFCRPNTKGMLSYKDFYDLEVMKKVEMAMGLFPNAQQICEWWALLETVGSTTNTKYKPAFVNDSQYTRLWESPAFTGEQSAKNHHIL